MNTGRHFFAEGEKQKAIQAVVHLIQQGFRTRGAISSVGVKYGAENAVKWAEEVGAIREEFDGTLLLADEKAPEFKFEIARGDIINVNFQEQQPFLTEEDETLKWTPVPEQLNDELNELMLEHLRHPEIPSGLVQVPLQQLYSLGLEGRCLLECKLPLDECLIFHEWRFFRRLLKYRGKAKLGYRTFTGRKEIVERAKKAASKKFVCETKSLGGKYDTWLLTVGERLPEYLNDSPEEGPVEF